MIPRKLASAAVCLALSAGLSGCFVTAGEKPAPSAREGTLSVAWTVDGAARPSACDARGADGMDIDVFDAADYQVASVNVACDAFVADFDLPAGDYSLDMTLVDAQDRAVSTRITLDTAVYAGSETDVDANFPWDSFF